MNAPNAAVLRDIAAGLLPWLAYGLGSASCDAGLGAVMGSLALIGVRLPRWRETKTFDLAILTFFVLLALEAYWLRWTLPDGLLSALCPLLLAVAALGSLLLNRPCSLQYARQMVGPAWWRNHHFLHVNRILTLAWAACFLAMAALAWFVRPGDISARAAIGAVNFSLFCVTIWFTRIFPRWYRLQRYLPLVRAGREPYLRALRR